VILHAEADPGFKKYSVFDTNFVIPEQYNIIEPMGAGAYGLVVAAIDSEA
jgi:hypothetical protein